MLKKDKTACCSPASGSASCCKVESLISVDERGQMVLPKDIRDKAGIRAGDKLAVISGERDGKICCLMLIKADDFSGMVKDLLGPVMQDIIASEKK